MRYVLQGAGTQGNTTKVLIGVDTETERVNLFEVFVKIPEGVSLDHADKEQSVVNVWVKEPSFDPETGTIHFVGGVPGGFQGRALLANFYLKADREGSYEISILPESQAFLNDGMGTEAEVSEVSTSVSLPAAQRDWHGASLLAVLIIMVIAAGAIRYIKKIRNKENRY